MASAITKKIISTKRGHQKTVHYPVLEIAYCKEYYNLHLFLDFVIFLVLTSTFDFDFIYFSIFGVEFYIHYLFIYIIGRRNHNSFISII